MAGFPEPADRLLPPGRLVPPHVPGRSLPLVCLEAAEAALPIVCFDHRDGGMPSFVENDAGIVVPYLDTAAMAGAVGRLLDDEATRKTLAEAAPNEDAAAARCGGRPSLSSSSSCRSCITPTRITVRFLQGVDRPHDVISFDIFDTLITRKVSDPNIVFDLVEYATRSRLSRALPL